MLYMVIERFKDRDAVAVYRRFRDKGRMTPQSRRALIVPNDVAYGLGRMFGMLRENQGEMGIRVFRNLEEALDWVFSKSTSA